MAPFQKAPAAQAQNGQIDAPAERLAEIRTGAPDADGVAARDRAGGVRRGQLQLDGGLRHKADRLARYMILLTPFSVPNGPFCVGQACRRLAKGAKVSHGHPRGAFKRKRNKEFQ